MLLLRLDHARQAKAYVPTNPFELEALVAARRLIVSTQLSQLTAQIRTPAIVIATHPSLRLGDAPTLLHHWKDDPQSLLLLTEASAHDERSYVNALLAPFMPARLQIARCAIDTRMGPTDAMSLLQTLRPRQIVMPHAPLGHRQMQPLQAAVAGQPSGAQPSGAR